jgi:glycosyltransferase involved in cell wall biosynthesis
VRSHGKPLSILYVAYPLLTVSDQSAGGAEQMLHTLEREMAVASHRTTVAASGGSQVSGELLVTGRPATAPDQYEIREREHSERVLAFLGEHPDEFDLIHDESGSFWRHAGQCEIPVLATLHLPRSFYRSEWFQELPSNLYFNCVSESQSASFSDLRNLIGAVQNGVAVERFPFRGEKGTYALWLGRICEEKGPHLAIEAARHAGVPLVLAGHVYPFRYHQQYFEREIRPHLSQAPTARVCFVNTPTFAEKVALLQHARALMLSSTAEETSSLVAMEAMACGTPVVAFRRGAFPEIVEDSETGFVVDTVEAMADALSDLDNISPQACRARVEHRFTSTRMAREYEEVYGLVLKRSSNARAA